MRNFSHLIDTIGYIPNGNRTYYVGRSQPPFYALMVELLVEDRGEGILLKYLAQFEREYGFWMKGAADLDDRRQSAHRSVRMPGGEVLNRYWDENDTARPESFQEDVELSRHSDQQPVDLVPSPPRRRRVRLGFQQPMVQGRAFLELDSDNGDRAG